MTDPEKVEPISDEEIEKYANIAKLWVGLHGQLTLRLIARIREQAKEIESWERRNANQVESYHILDNANKQHHITEHRLEAEVATLLKTLGEKP